MRKKTHVPPKPAEKAISYSDEIGEALDLAKGLSNLLAETDEPLDENSRIVLWAAAEKLVEDLETVNAAFDETPGPG